MLNSFYIVANAHDIVPTILFLRIHLQVVLPRNELHNLIHYLVWLQGCSPYLGSHQLSADMIFCHFLNQPLPKDKECLSGMLCHPAIPINWLVVLGHLFPDDTRTVFLTFLPNSLSSPPPFDPTPKSLDSRFFEELLMLGRISSLSSGQDRGG